MTIPEIKEALKQQGMSVKELAEKLGMSYTNTRLMLSGARPMSLQIERHIDYILGAAKTQAVMITVDLPETVARVWAPGWETLTEAEQEAAGKAVLEAAADALIKRGASIVAEYEGRKQPGGELPTVGGSAPTGTDSAAYAAPLDSMA